MNNKEVSKAVDTLITALNDDEEYRETWKANIAMSFYDEYNNSFTLNDKDKEAYTIHEVANNAAERFLTMLCTR